MTAPYKVDVDGAGEGEAIAISGEQIVVVIERAFAPGAPIRFDLAHDEGSLTLEGRTVGSKRRDDGRFDVRVRLINLRREDRDRLRALAT